jgi:hypothetical protein
VLALWLCSSTTAWSQDNLKQVDLYVTLSGVIAQNVCGLLSFTQSLDTPMVVNLPPLQTTMLLNAAYSPVITVPMKLQLSDTTASCANLANTKMLFDTPLAGVTTSSGLLRNHATLRPAQNMMVQLGVVNASGVFTPLNLNEPLVLNDLIRSNGSTTSSTVNLALGIRYVAARVVYEQFASVDPLSSANSEVTAGNVSVRLPFLLSLN